MSQPIRHPGFVIWFTGLSGAGKTTICSALEPHLRAAGLNVESLDGDVVRTHLSKGLGFSKEDRDTNVRRIGFVADLLQRNGVAVLCSLISPYRATRDELRATIGEGFIEVFADAPIEVCETREGKIEMYRKARAGEIKEFTGVSDPYEPPYNAEIHLNTSATTVQECVERMLVFLADRGLLPQPVNTH